MNFLEKDLEQIIWESDNLKLQQRNLDIEGKKIRQLRIGNYGILDLLTVEKCYYENDFPYKQIPYLNITVYELKKEKVGISAFLQAIRYCRGIKSYLEDNKPNIRFKLNIVLCAKEVDIQSDFIFMIDMVSETYFPNQKLNNIKAYSFEYNLDGINFIRKHGYDLTSKGF